MDTDTRQASTLRSEGPIGIMADADRCAGGGGGRGRGWFVYLQPERPPPVATASLIAKPSIFRTFLFLAHTPKRIKTPLLLKTQTSTLPTSPTAAPSFPARRRQGAAGGRGPRGRRRILAAPHPARADGPLPPHPNTRTRSARYVTSPPPAGARRPLPTPCGPGRRAREWRKDRRR